MALGVHQQVPQYLLEESIARTVEQERLDKIYHDSRTLKQTLAAVDGRCEVCTLKPPCRHNKEVPPDYKEETEAERERRKSRLIVGIFAPGQSTDKRQDEPGSGHEVPPEQQ
jgi:hypothetical protein